MKIKKFQDFINESDLYYDNIPDNILDHWLYHYDIWCKENNEEPEYEDVDEIRGNSGAIDHVYYHADIYAQENGFKLDGVEYMEDNIQEKVNNKQDLNFDIKYGLIVLNREDLENGIYEILHFVGYEKEPNEIDIKSLMEELKTDDSFGLTDLVDNLIIIRAADETVEEYKKIVSGGDKLLEGKIQDVENTGHGVKYRNETFPGINQPKRYEGKGKHKWRVLAKEGEKVKIINFGAKSGNKEQITKLNKKYWENYWK